MATSTEDRIARRAIVAARLADAAERGLTHGEIFELTADVENPAKDARRKRDWRYRPILAKGMRFRVTLLPDEEVGPRPKLANIASWDHYDIGCGHDLWPVLVPHLVRVPPTLAERISRLLDDTPIDAADVLAALIETGRLTWEDVERLAQRLSERDEEIP